MNQTIFENQFCKVEKIETTATYVLTSKRDMYPPQNCLTLDEVSKKTMIPVKELEAGDTPEPINFTRVNSDTNGNPRYVCHYHALLTPAELEASAYDYQGRTITPSKYDVAVKRAHSIGGRKFHNKQYGGGIVFQSYNIRETEKDIRELVKKSE